MLRILGMRNSGSKGIITNIPADEWRWAIPRHSLQLAGNTQGPSITVTMALIVLIALLACASAARPPQAAPLAALPPQAALSTGLNASAATSIPCTVKGCT